MSEAHPPFSTRSARCQVIALLLLCLQLQPAAADGIAYLAVAEDGLWQVWHMAGDGSGQRQVTTSPYDKSRVSWYPDGRTLLVNGNQGELARVDFAKGRETPIRLDLTGMNDAVIAPDGRRIAFSRSTSGGVDDHNIWVAELNGSGETGTLRKLTKKRFLQHEPAWSPDGLSVYFLSGKGDQDHDIWRADLAVDGQVLAMTQLTAGSLYHFDLAPGPNGQIAFSANRSGNYDIWLDRQGEEPVQLTGHPALDARPSWSPDGKAIAFESSRDGGLDIWRLSVDGGEPVRLTRHPAGARMPVWFSGGAN